MAKMDKEAKNESDLYDMWKSKVSVAKDHFDKFKGKELKQYRKAYEGDQWSDDQKAKYNNEVVDNMVYMVVSTLGPAIGMSRPEVYVTSRKSSVMIQGKKTDPSLAAARLKTLLDFMWKKLDLEVEFMKTISDSLIAHDGYQYTGYDMEVYETETDSGQKIDLIESENIVCQRLDPAFVLKDMMSTDPDFKDARWIAIKWERALDEIKNDPNYSGVDNLEPNGTIQFDKITERYSFAAADRTVGQPTTNINGADKWAEAVEGWDIWDKKNKNFYSIVLTHDKFLRKEKQWPLSYNGNGFPIDVLWYNYNPSKPYPLADTGLYLSKQMALNFLESILIDHADVQSNVKVLIDQKKIPPGQSVESWLKGPAWSFLKTKGDPNTAAAILGQAPGAGELFSTIQALKRDILQQVGVDQFMVGAPEKLETAGEVDKISQGSTAKHAFRSRAVERFESKVLTKLANVIQQVSTETEIPLDDGQFNTFANVAPELLVNGEQSQDLGNGSMAQEKLPFMRVDNELLQGEFDFEVKIGSTKHTDENAEKQDASLLTQFANTNPLINKVEVTKIALEKLGFGHYMDRILRDPKEVANEQKQSFQAKMEAQMAEPKLKTQTDMQKTLEKNKTALQSAMIKAQTSQAVDQGKQLSDEKDRNNSLLQTVLKIVGDKNKASGNGGDR
jgi:hypothetical protein